MKVKNVTPEQLAYVFGLQIHPTMTATQGFWGTPPPGHDVLGVSPDRGGTCPFHQFTVSTFGEGSQRVVGYRVWDPRDRLYKEDLYVYASGSPTMGVWMKGTYQWENPLYANTHHTYPACTSGVVLG
jgi:hypothetical protein